MPSKLPDQLEELARRWGFSESLRAELLEAFMDLGAAVADGPELSSGLADRTEVDADTMDESAGLWGEPSEKSELWLEDTLTSAPPLVSGETPFVLHDSRERYRVGRKLGEGGMGKVHRVRDGVLERLAARKVLHESLAEAEDSIGNFLREAQITAQLQHPGVVSVHDMGRLGDGRWFFTMDEIRGHHLGRYITHVHNAIEDGQWTRTSDGWDLHRLLDAFLRVCEAVGYAHEHGVVHLDLKPANLMVGIHGQILVVDWGLAEFWQPEGKEDRSGLVDVAPQLRPAPRKEKNVVIGTPAYMPPERLSGEQLDPSPLADVYALGAVLYSILAGRPPYSADKAVPAHILRKPPAAIHEVASAAAPEALVAIQRRAMHRDMSRRYGTALALAEDLRQFLSGAQRQQKAHQQLQQVQSIQQQLDETLKSAQSYRKKALQLMQLRPKRLLTSTVKEQAWSLEDQADELDRTADRLRVDQEQLLLNALSHEPELKEAHLMLALIYKEDHAQAELLQDREAMLFAEARLRTHVQSLQPSHPERATLERYLSGQGALSLLTDPETLEVSLERYLEQKRRLIPHEGVELGTTPISQLPLDMGSYRLRARDRHGNELLYPIWIGRNLHWRGRSPEGTESTPVRFLQGVPEGCRYIPAGWCWNGGDDVAHASLPRRWSWVDGFVIQQFPVTLAQYQVYLQDLLSSGRLDRMRRSMPRHRGSPVGTSPFFTLDRGRVRITLSEIVTSEHCPVTLVGWDSALSYARWLSERTGMAWRLPESWEWEKAARGVDGRIFPWGHFCDESWAAIRRSESTLKTMPEVGRFPLDESPYGVRDMAGGVSEWTQTIWTTYGPHHRKGRFQNDPLESPYRVCRGGNWRQPEQSARLSQRMHHATAYKSLELGFRLAFTV